jgi:hypothetical protein
LIGSGAALLLIHLAVRQFRSRGVRFSDLGEAVSLALTPIVLPGATEMILKAFGGETLPIFNGPEDRLALFIGGAAVIAGIAYCNFLAFERAWKNRRS